MNRLRLFAVVFLGLVANFRSTQRTLKYFAYGSNVKVSTLIRRLGDSPPQIQYNAILAGHRLAFSVPGLPFVEPSFATIRKEFDPNQAVWGVVYHINERGYTKLMRSEGVPLVYVPISVEVTTEEGVSMDCMTLIAPNSRCFPLGIEVQPSRRYFDLIIDGLNENCVDKCYVEKLERKWSPLGQKHR